MCCTQYRGPERLSDMYRLYDALCERENEDGSAILVSASELIEDIWVPREAILEESEVRGEGDNGTLVVTDKFARDEGLG